jgi:hypothetical protein
MMMMMMMMIIIIIIIIPLTSSRTPPAGLAGGPRKPAARPNGWSRPCPCGGTSGSRCTPVEQGHHHHHHHHHHHYSQQQQQHSVMIIIIIILLLPPPLNPVTLIDTFISPIDPFPPPPRASP